MIYVTFRQAIKNIWSNKFRTFLTMLGIIIGIMAVMIIVGLGNGLTESMRASVSSMGMNLLQVNVYGPRARNVDIQEMYVYEQAEGDEDSYVIDRDQLDLEPAIRDAVVMALPFNPSRDESEEFSYTLGEDLEVDEDESESPFASLKNLLEEKKES